MKDIVPAAKFSDPFVTAKGDTRASVPFNDPQTLWFNTGTLCNIECENCYILSSPTNDALVYITQAEVETYLDQLDDRNWQVREIGFTGGEPFMNPEILGILEASLARGYEVLVLTNAMQPLQRKRVKEGLLKLRDAYPGKLTLRVSVDHYTKPLHDRERGKGSFEKMVAGMIWLRDNGFKMAVAGRTVWGEDDAASRSGYGQFFKDLQLEIDPLNPAQTMLFPEMDERVEVPEITTECWGILGKSPTDMMCASSRMVVKRKGADTPVVLACTLLAYSEEFEFGKTLEDAECDTYLNHPHCAKFCVLGGASCSA